MKKIYLRGVYKKNLGDDLLIKILCDRYKNSKFYSLNYRNGSKKSPSENLYLKNINSKFYKVLNNSFARLKKINPIEAHYINKSDFVIIIGGSIFMERKDFIKDKKIFGINWYNNLNKNYYIIGANIGPVYTDEYISRIKEGIISKATDVCLRDKKSYSYLKDCKNVRVGSDIVFSMDINKDYSKEEKKKVIISVIDIDKKSNQIINPNQEKYDETICNMIDLFINKNYEVELFSFCKSEGDEIAIERILEKNKYKDKVNKYYYDGNIKKALDELGTAKIIVGTRFHANIIGMIMKKTVIPIIYNDKTREMLNDINFKGKFIDIERIEEFNVNNITEKDLEYKIDIKKSKEEAERHFKELDKILK